MRQLLNRSKLGRNTQDFLVISIIFRGLEKIKNHWARKMDNESRRGREKNKRLFQATLCRYVVAW